MSLINPNDGHHHTYYNFHLLNVAINGSINTEILYEFKNAVFFSISNVLAQFNWNSFLNMHDINVTWRTLHCVVLLSICLFPRKVSTQATTRLGSNRQVTQVITNYFWMFYCNAKHSYDAFTRYADQSISKIFRFSL